MADNVASTALPIAGIATASSTFPIAGTSAPLKRLIDSIRENLKQPFGWHETNGAAKTATKLATARILSVDGAAASATNPTFDGSANAVILLYVSLSDDTASNGLPPNR